nr:phosphotransferase [Tsukamurella sp. 1534]
MYRCGETVVRVGATFRDVGDVAWCSAVAAAVARRVPEAIAPMPTADGRLAAGVSGRPVSLWPFVPGLPGDDADPNQRRRAAHLLARVHAALAGVTVAVTPRRRMPAAPVPDLHDPALDTWLEEYGEPTPQLIHGDFYADNVITDDRGTVIALIDWDEAAFGSAEKELAGAAWEWGRCRESLDLTPARRFVDDYAAAGGTADRLDDTALRQLIRARVRDEIAYDRATAASRSADAEDEDDEYQRLQVRAFTELRP